MQIDLVPDSAPFTPEQRAWLNGFFAGLFGDTPAPAAPVIDAPWHDPALDLDSRLTLAKGRALPDRLMAAMGQLDCSQCGYDCAAYARAIADGAEGDLKRCQPGGVATARVLKRLMSEAPAVSSAAPAARASGLSEARLIEAAPLNGPESDKDTRAIRVATDLAYEPGDSLSVMPRNCPELVAEILERLGRPDAPEAGRLETACDLGQPSDEFLGLMADVAIAPADRTGLQALLEADPGDLDVLGVLDRFPSARPSPEALLASLSPLRPRLYSIASSPRAHPGEVHLTVATVRWRVGDRTRKGVASTFLADRVAPGGVLSIAIQAAHGFRPPADPATDMIMIGPGTGIAPFRAFLQHRRATGATGRNWLFFGDRREACDFLYRDELMTLRSEGVLTRLDTAFSRDGAGKLYVQHRMAEAADTLWDWLAGGAAVYVCGDAKAMARDVEATLLAIAAERGGQANPAAWLADLARAGRYCRDVY